MSRTPRRYTRSSLASASPQCRAWTWKLLALALLGCDFSTLGLDQHAEAVADTEADIALEIIAEADFYTALSGTLFTVEGYSDGILANDLPQTGEAPATICVQAPERSSLLSAEIEVACDGTFTYHAEQNSFGCDRFDYTIVNSSDMTLDALMENTVHLSTRPTMVSLNTLVPGLTGTGVHDQNKRHRLGMAVATIGDFDGDGYDDVAIASIRWEKLYEDVPDRVFIVFGDSQGLPTSLEESQLGERVLRVEGYTYSGGAGEPSMRDLFGAALAPAGDVNGDGLADLVVGAPNSDNDADNDGTTYVILGAPERAEISLPTLTEDARGFQITGHVPGARSGSTVAGAGDVNGDGLDDIIVGVDASPTNDEGAAYILLSSTALSDRSLGAIQQGVDGFAVIGAAGLGAAVAGVGDVDGDGLDDVAIGAPYHDGVGEDAGRVYVVLGQREPELLHVGDLAGGNEHVFTIDGAGAYTHLGWSVAGAGDVNGDGFDDVIIGAPGGLVNGEHRGLATVVLGSNKPDSLNLEQLTEDIGGFVMSGEHDDDNTGWSVHAAGDLDSDGFDDLVIGASRAQSTTGLKQGRVYVHFGAPEPTRYELASAHTGDRGFVLEPGPQGQSLGWSVSGAGDINGDGYDDLLVADPSGAHDGIDGGAAYTLLGGCLSNKFVLSGDSEANELVGDDQANRIVGDLGADTIVGNGGGDVLRGGAGDDTLLVSDGEFRIIDGGAGLDTLELVGSGIVVDLTARRGRLVRSVERIELGGAGNTLRLDVRDLLELGRDEVTVHVEGRAGDRVEANLQGDGFEALGQVGEYIRYSNGVIELQIAMTVIADVLT